MSPQPRHTLACIGQVPLKFTTPVRDHLSAVAASPDGQTLWLASRAAAAVERLRLSPDGAHFAAHDTVPLRDRLALPGAAGEAADIQGLALQGGYLWMVGSHGLVRRSPESADGAGAPRGPPTTIGIDASRFLFARLPLEGADANAAAVTDKLKQPGGETLRTGRLEVGERSRHRKAAATRSTISTLLSKDDHLASFLDIPDKENGFAIGSMAIIGGRILLGLRGPVLDGSAIVVEIGVETGKRGALAPAALGDGAGLYRKHALDLDGLGVRALLVHGDDILILAGPTMALDGPVRLYAWRGGAATAADPDPGSSRAVDYLADLPHGDRDDHAAGMALLQLPHTHVERLLVVYDNPARSRRIGEHGVLADLFAFPG